MQNANDKTYSFTAAAVDNAVDLCRLLMKWHNIPPENVIRHYDVTGKPCPGIDGWNADSGSEKDWEKFKARITNKSTNESTDNDVWYIVAIDAFEDKRNADKRLAEVKQYFPKSYITTKKKG
jgi:N-acetylmuramoyl-L-alanine amidase CwlA